MNFPDVKNWIIPEGSVKKVRDSQNRIIWQKDTYLLIDYVTASTSRTGVIVPFYLPRATEEAKTWEIMMDFQYSGGIEHASSYNSAETVTLMGADNPYVSGNSDQHSAHYIGWQKNTTVTNWPLRTIIWNRRNGSGTDDNDENRSNLNLRHVIKITGPTNSSGNSDITGTRGKINSIVYPNTSNFSSASGYYYLTYRSVGDYWGFGVWSDANGSALPYGKFLGNIYECYIKINDEYTCHLYPALREKYGTYGLYDVINNVFYPSVTENPFTHEEIPIESMSIADLEVPIGGTAKPTVITVPVLGTPDLTWESENPSIATIDEDGTITGVSYGNVTMIATDKTTGISTTFNVLSYIPTESISISPEYPVVSVGGSITLYPNISPANATHKEVTWQIRSQSGSRGNITISKNSDQTCTVTGVEPSTASRCVVWARAYNGQYSNNSNIKVQTATIAVTGVSLNKTSDTIGINGQTQLVATVKPDDATTTTISWSSSNSSIASVNSAGLVTGKAAGTATITATCGGKSATCTITVKAPDPVESVTINPSSVTLEAGSTQFVTASVSPSTVGSVTYTWSSDDTSIASVNSNGKITAVAPGTTTVRCIVTGYGGSSAEGTCTVTVQAVVYKYRLTVNGPSGSTVTFNGYGSGSETYSVLIADGTNISYSVTKDNYVTETNSWTLDGADKTIDVSLNPVRVNGVTLNQTTAEMYVNGTLNLTATVSPSNALNKSVTWSSSNTSVATVNQSGKVTAITAGTTTITVTTADGNYTATCTITVLPITTRVTGVTVAPSTLAMNVGDERSLTATVAPSDASNKTVHWSSSNTSVATVNENGLVTAVGNGSATITATTDDGNYTNTCNVTVTTRATGITLDKHSVTVRQNDVVTLTATISPNNVSDTNIHIGVNGDATHVYNTTNNGNVWTINWKADANSGQAQITVTTSDGSYSDTCTMNIISIIPVTGVSLDKSSLSLNVGDTSQLTATVSPSNATDKSVTWSSSDTSVATVSSSGVVTAQSGGSATITCTTQDGGKTATCSVIVIVPVTGVSLNRTTLSLTKNATYDLVATVSPSNATNKNVIWSTNNSNIASVSNGVVTANSIGDAIITVTTADGGYTATCTVYVREPETYSVTPSSVSVDVGKTVTITANSSPSSKLVMVQTANHNIATVSPAGSVTIPNTFTITGVSEGNTKIVFSLSSGTLMECDVTVMMPVKHLQIVNNDDNPIYYHTEDYGDRSLTAGSTTSVSLTTSDSLYIRTTDSIQHTVDLDCNSDYTTSSGYYKITYAHAVDGDSITVFR